MADLFWCEALRADGRISPGPKVVAAFHDRPIAQMLGHLTIIGLEVARLGNFRESKLTGKRRVSGEP